MIKCLNCKFWNRPEGWADFRKFRTDEPYDWSEHSSECSKLPDIDHVDIYLDIHGNASVDSEISTCGTFGCILGEPRDEDKHRVNTPSTFKVWGIARTCDNETDYYGPYQTKDDAIKRLAILPHGLNIEEFEVEVLEDGRFIIDGKAVCGQFEYVDVDSGDAILGEEIDNDFLGALCMLSCSIG